MGPKPTTESNPRKTCEFCGRTFARNEHLIRHRRTHTSEKPFECPHCELSFPRSDVKDRHVERHHSQDDEDDASLNSLKRKRRPGSGVLRSKLACDECRRRKLKCNNLHPCEGCRSRNLPCTVSTNSRPPGRPRAEAEIVNVIDAEEDQERQIFTVSSVAEQSYHHRPPSMVLTPSTSLQDSNQARSISQILSSDRPESSSAGFDPENAQSDQSLVGNFDRALGTDTTLNDYQLPGSGGPDDLGDVVQDWDMDSMDFMNGFWQLPQMAGDTWLDDLEPGLAGFDFLTHPMTFPEDLPSTPMQSAIDLMRNYFQARSRAPSPPAGEATQMWYSRQPRLQIYDKDIVNVFLNLARRHLAGTFKIVADFEAFAGTSEELCLAMAAIGGLFCEVPGSMNIAKALHNDSRRIAIENAFMHTSRDSNQSRDLVKAFILIELYGLCSGDQRCFELGEAFHGDVFQESRNLFRSVGASMTDRAKRETSLIFEALHILECYRAILLLRPPTFLPLYNKDFISTSDSPSVIDDWTNEVSRLLSPIGKIDGMKNPMVSLAAISCLSYMSAGRHTLYNDQPLWRSEFTELALDRWFQAQSQPLDLSKTLIYHMTHINVHTDLALLQRFAQSVAKSRRSLAEENAQIHSWIVSEHFKSARWHAERNLAAVRNETSAKSRRTEVGKTNISSRRDRPHHQQQTTPGDASVMAEPPHLPYCIYFSILIMWYEDRQNDEGDPARWSACIDGLVPLLFGLRSRVAKLLGNALVELKVV